MSRAFLLQASLLGQFWVDAAYAVTFVINRLPTPVLDSKSPLEWIFQKPPDYSCLRVFGCECFPTLLTRSYSLNLSQKDVFFLAGGQRVGCLPRIGVRQGG